MSTEDSPTFASFNPTHDDRVTQVKEMTDSIIKFVRDQAEDTPEGKRRAALAVTNYEQAAMWAVKSFFS